MQVKFWGTRGSVPVSGARFAEFGGNTPCLEVRLESSPDVLLIDAGTGIREFSNDLFSRGAKPSPNIHLFLTHAHWDHIQGFPFFGAAYSPEFRLHIYCSKDAEEFLSRQMSPPFFPVGLDAMLAPRTFHRLQPDQKVMLGDAAVSWIPLPHPQESTAFRVDEDGKSFVLATDTEHPSTGINERLVEFAKGTDALIYDAQYTPDEYQRGKQGWGHSTFREGVAVIEKAKAKQLILFSHDPSHADDACRAIEKEAQQVWPNTLAARQEMVLDL
ncbi:MAG: MBL fold metallo-hydrolase [Planctomycetota bacterium]